MCNAQGSNNKVEKAPPNRRKKVQKGKLPRARYGMHK
jgi:hypothetical protein